MIILNSAHPLIEEKASSIESILEWLGEDLEKVDQESATADHHGAVLRRMLNLAVEWQHLDRNVLAKFPLFRAPNQRDHFLAPEQLARLVEVLRTDRRRNVCRVAMFLLSTGARLNEALSAKWRDIDIPNRRWTILAETAKSKRTGSVPLNDSALMVLEEVGTRGRYEDVYVNPRTGKAYAAVFRVWSRIRAKAGPRATAARPAPRGRLAAGQRRPLAVRGAAAARPRQPGGHAEVRAPEHADLLVRGQVGLMFGGDLNSFRFILESLLFAGACLLSMTPAYRNSLRWLFVAACLMLLAGSVYRFNAYIVGFNPGPGWSYFPALPEVMITLGIIAFELMAYLYFVKRFPVLPKLEHS